MSNNNSNKPNSPAPLRFNFKSLDGILQGCEDIANALANDEIDARKGGSMNGAAANAMKAFIQHGPAVQNVIQTGPSIEEIVASFTNSLPSDLKNALRAYAQQQAKLETVTATN